MKQELSTASKKEHGAVFKTKKSSSSLCKYLSVKAADFIFKCFEIRSTSIFVKIGLVVLQD